jgi:enoyl-CoA hydratase/carnithine racemase
MTASVTYQTEALAPTVTSTVLVTLFFGLFGLIPAAGNTNRARALGLRTRKYWAAFGITFAASTVLWLTLWTMVVVAGASVAPQ